MKKERCVESKRFNLETDVLAAKEAGCTGILALRVFARAMLAMRMFAMIVCQFDETQQRDVAT
ncbi:MAG: hypothetical protein OXH39_03005 [Candidatus Poribacteria bacterium]|nr:hypothetical protein [Candidatus Poribacteria bacterium]